MRSLTPRLSAAAVVGACLVAAPVGATAASAAPAAHTTAAAATSGASSDGTIARWTQRSVTLDTGSSVSLEVEARGFATIVLERADGSVVDEQDVTPWRTAFFTVEPNGDDSEQFRITAYGTQAEAPVDVTVDYRGLSLHSPYDDLSERDADEIRRALAQGQGVHRVPFVAVPGARVDVTVNGVAHTAVAGADGRAVVETTLRLGDNAVSAQQSVKGKQSPLAEYDYTF